MARKTISSNYPLNVLNWRPNRNRRIFLKALTFKYLHKGSKSFQGNIPKLEFGYKQKPPENNQFKLPNWQGFIPLLPRRAPEALSGQIGRIADLHAQHP